MGELRTEKMAADVSELGTVACWLGHHHADWSTNENEYRFQPLSKEGITLSAVKRNDKTIEIRLAGPYSRSYLFVSEIPPCPPRGLFVVLRWNQGKVTLSLNNQDTETKDKDAPLLELSGQAFLSTSDEGLRALELAIAFDVAGTIIVDRLVGAPQSLDGFPMLPIPAVVCDAFSIELYLKSLLWMDLNKRVKGHKLYELFHKLNQTTQQEVISVYDRWRATLPIPVTPTPVPIAFDDVLRGCSTAFEYWRYMHEVDKTGTELFAASGIKMAVKGVARSRRPQAFEKTPTTPPTSPPL